MPLKLSTLWLEMLLALALLGCMSMQTGCSSDRPVLFVTGQDYIRLQQGQTFVADRPMMLATESVIQRKDQQILDLLEANRRMATELNMRRPE